MSIRHCAFLGLALIAAATELGAQSPQKRFSPSGNRIIAHDGDTIVVENDARIAIVRRRNANVRAVFNRAERWLVLLADYPSDEGGPDGRVDATYDYSNVAGDWPLEDRWEGAAIIEDYTMAVEGMGGIGLFLPNGLVQLLGMGHQVFRDPTAISVLSFAGESRGGAGGRAFDEVERMLVAQARRNSAGSRGQPPGSMSVTASGPTIESDPTQVPGDQPVRVGGNIRPPEKIHDVRPVMPEQAERAGISGVVIVEITVDRDGSVSNARVLRSIPLLDRAALDAVRQWRYTPTTLGGQPVPVIMTVTVNFP